MSSYLSNGIRQYEKYDPHAYTWTPSIGLNDSLQQYPFASPNSNTTYLCQASDGRCTMEAEVDVVCTNLSNTCQSMTLDRSIDGNVLTWTQDIYSSNVFFQIERSFDGISFDMIDIIPSTTSSDSKIFSYLDYTAESKWDYYYRVGLLTDIDQLTYSCPISHIKGVSTQQEFDIFPNPTGDQLFISTEIRLEETSITILDLSGKQIDKIWPVGNEGFINVSNLAPGSYLIHIDCKESPYSKVCKFTKL